MKESLENLAQRQVNAIENWCEVMFDMHGLNERDAMLVLTVYIRVRAVKLDGMAGKYTVTHGGYLDRATIDLVLNKVAQ